MLLLVSPNIATVLLLLWPIASITLVPVVAPTVAVAAVVVPIAATGVVAPWSAVTSAIVDLPRSSIAVLDDNFVLGCPAIVAAPRDLGLGAGITAPILERAIKATTSRKAIFLRDTSWRPEPKVLAGDGNLKTGVKD